MKLCLAAKAKCLRFVEGQLNQADARVSTREGEVPFLLALRGTRPLAPVAVWGAEGAIPAGSRALSSSCSPRCAVGLLRPALPRQEAATADGRSVCPFHELVRSAGAAPRYPPGLWG